MTQYRITTTKANVREEAHIEARSLAILNQGDVLNGDDQRTPDGDWLPVLLVKDGYPLEIRHCWIHSSVVEAIE